MHPVTNDLILRKYYTATCGARSETQPLKMIR